MPFSPLRSLSAHRSSITAVVSGHSTNLNNIVVTASKDGTLIVWNYFAGLALHTYLLPHGPLCMALDPADRAIYAGYENGSIQLLDFYRDSGSTNPLHDPRLRTTPSQALDTDIWSPPDGNASAVLSLDVSYDGTLLISGHANGKIMTWDVATGRFQKEVIELSAPITNLITLPPEGFPNEPQPRVKLHKVTKPHYEGFGAGGSSSDGTTVPSSYVFNVQLKSRISTSGSHSQSTFEEALTNPLFSASLMDEGKAELSFLQGNVARAEDSSASEDLRKQNVALSSQLESLLAQQQRMEAMNKSRDKADWARRQDEEIKAAKKKRRRLLRIKAEEVSRKREMGELAQNDDEDDEMTREEEEKEEEEEEEEEDLSSSTDEN